jgi:hypothetical protein
LKKTVEMLELPFELASQFDAVDLNLEGIEPLIQAFLSYKRGQKGYVLIEYSQFDVLSQRANKAASIYYLSTLSALATVFRPFCQRHHVLLEGTLQTVALAKFEEEETVVRGVLCSLSNQVDCANVSTLGFNVKEESEVLKEALEKAGMKECDILTIEMGDKEKVKVSGCFIEKQ